jgi:tripartite-type tricarboxylate transporter receptor subunit TctC
MKGHKRIQRIVLAVFCLVAPVSQALAQEWPSRTIAVVVPLGAGSASDVIARVVMDQVSQQLGQTIVVENRPGAGGTIGAAAVAKANPDGYTILVYGALASAHALYARLPYDTLNDFVPVIPLGQQPLALVTSPAKGYRNLGDLIAAARAKPGALNYASAGIGSASHFAAERLRVSAGIEVQNITFKGASEALTEILAGRLDFTIQPLATTVNLVRDGKLAALAVSAHRRASSLPDVPTLEEAGLRADAVYPFYTAVFVPAKTPPEIVDKLQRETARALQAANVQTKLATFGVEPMAMSRDEFAKFFRDDVDANVALVKAAGIQIQ